MENNKATIETLNDLVQINNDRIRGYESAIKETKDDAELVSVFNNKILESQQFKSTLTEEIQVLGNDADNTTTVSGTIHRTWLEVKAAFSGHSEKSILEECEFGEDAIKKAYQSALNEEHLPAFIRDILNDQQAILSQSHDEIKALRDSVSND
ncbi:PA2169 family four-helix-bundle protein [Mucilaginibacter sp. UR6-11]|uniref:PA2169 family four-helix-bundle protein n=1 Tax=Mucilaginibacter sp. UR6-11 TaxID=1435644 RepID=UPI001E31392A|nr:PA2169 family four-helix-bundle protein [Mucilaginibacter sp. UR6-11]MCC8423390.1 PA2169 family four-helix-bundle protein [Mucilaginibacter sp. UR6-11]